MATQETRKLDSIIADRRALLTLGGAAAAGLALGGLAPKAKAQTTFTDTDILNFALNLEYLEAQFYTLAASGVTADSSTLPNPIGTGAGNATTGGATVVTKGNNNYASCKVPFATTVADQLNAAYALEIAFEERNHVIFLRNALGTGAVPQPSLDLVNSFKGLGALLTPAQPNFDPFASGAFFLLGAYIFEDVGVSAYHGASGLIQDKVNVLPPAAALHAAEAYHAGIIRTTLLTTDPTNTMNGGLLTLASSISQVRATLDGTFPATSTTPADDVGLSTTRAVTLNSGTTVSGNGTTEVDADSNYLGWSRTAAQVLKIVYAGQAGGGGFFPSGMNGNIK